MIPYHVLQYSDIVDIGAESTRPGATPVSAEEEIIRLEPILKSILPEKNIEISIDTYHAKTAEFALKNGADIINSVDFDEETAKVVAKYGAKVVVMARDTDGKLENTVIALNNLMNLAKKNGVEEKNIILDAGIGFIGGASADLLALKNLPKLKNTRKLANKFFRVFQNHHILQLEQIIIMNVTMAEATRKA